MKSQLLVTLALTAIILSLGTIPAQAENKVFTESGEIVDGDVWVLVDIYNDDTVVDMSGGMCDYITTYNGSTLNMSGGDADGKAMDYSTINLSGGTFNGFSAIEGTVYLNGIAQGDYLEAVDGAVNVISGNIERVLTYNNGIANLHGGNVSRYISASDLAVINIHGYDLAKTATGGFYNQGQVSGFWMDDSSFTIDLKGDETFNRINLIPEPSILLLFGLGSVFLRRKK